MPKGEPSSSSSTTCESSPSSASGSTCSTTAGSSRRERPKRCAPMLRCNRPTWASDVLLQMVDVCAGYDRMQILHGIGLSVKEGHLVAIVGPNGSGKTTALKALIGLIRPTRGNVIFAGE